MYRYTQPYKSYILNHIQPQELTINFQEWHEAWRPGMPRDVVFTIPEGAVEGAPLIVEVEDQNDPNDGFCLHFNCHNNIRYGTWAIYIEFSL